MDAWNSIIEFIDASKIFNGLIVSAIVALIGRLIWLDRNNTAMGKHPTAIDKEFPEKEYKARLAAFCRVLSKDIDDINRETSWSEEYFTPLDAEVEVKSRNGRKKKITDILKAIKKDTRTKAFLVLGDPGSGKSVALRKLCNDLLKEVDRTGKVPIYINLREWEIKERWTEAKPPTVTQLYNFVVDNIKSRGDIFTEDFVNVYFKKMYDHGRIFFILDSFDEIPAVMDIDQDSWLIDRLSSVIFTFLAGAQESRGVLSSRIFRKPTKAFDAKTKLEIRPFSDDKIIQRFEKSFSIFPHLKETLFKERIDLVGLARNPFTAALIVNYARKEEKKLPKNQAELYQYYIEERLDVVKDKLAEKKIDIKQVYQMMIDTAYLMFENESYGLEIPMKELTARLADYPVAEIVDILLRARLIRLGRGSDRLFSFVHRRFNEYFVAQTFIKKPALIPRDAIPTDSRWRDALVMYCEVAEEEKAREIANFCWAEIRKIKDEKLNLSDPQYRRAIHSLRFLKDAFHSRLDIIKGFREELSCIVEEQIDKENILETKLVIESVGILDEKKINNILVKAISLNYDWITETAIRSCRHIPEISKELEKRIITYLNFMPFSEVYRRKKELLLSFSLSEGFKPILREFKFKLYYMYLFGIGGGLMLVVFCPLLLIFLLILTLEELGAARSIDNVFFSQKNENEFQNTVTDESEKTVAVIENYFDKLFSKMSLSLGRYREYFDKYITIHDGPIFEVPVLNPFYISFGIIIMFFPFNNAMMNWSINNSYSFIPEILIVLFNYLGVVLILPWLEMSKIRGTRVKRFNLIQFITNLLKVTLFALPLYLMAALLIIPLMFVIIPYLGLHLFKEILNIIYIVKDFFTLRKTKIPPRLNKDEILAHLKQFKTRGARARFIHRLEENSTEIYGKWPNGEIPFKGERVHILLAQIEEKLLGFDR